MPSVPSVRHTNPIVKLIDRNVPIVSPHTYIREIKELLLSQSRNFDSINYIYVVNHKKELVGVLSIKEVLSLDDNARVAKDMVTDIVYVHPYSRRERAAHVALKNNIKAVPVIDKDNKFWGVISSDKILQITNDEITEDMLLLEGIHTKEFALISTIDNSPLKLLGKRIPWLLVGLIGGLLAAQIIGVFEDLLAYEILLISFLPLMVYMSDAVGSQSQTIFIRYIAINGNDQIIKYFLRENFVGLLIAFCLSSLLALVVTMFYSFMIGIIVGVSLLLTVIVSVSIAILVPWGLIRLNKDPAIASGPFATIIRDIIAIAIYFFVASLILPF